jgi:hypothetical protein
VTGPEPVATMGVRRKREPAARMVLSSREAMPPRATVDLHLGTIFCTTPKIVRERLLVNIK